MPLNIGELLKLINKMPSLSELQTVLDQELNKQKLIFIDQLKTQNRDPNDKHLDPETQNKVKSEQIEHSKALYKEMNSGITTCAHELENLLKAERDNPNADKEKIKQLENAQKTVGQLSLTMTARMEALGTAVGQQHELDHQQEIVRLREVEQLQRAKKIATEEEIKKKEEKDKITEKVCDMLLPPIWAEAIHNRHQREDQEMRAELHPKDLHAGEKKEHIPEKPVTILIKEDRAVTKIQAVARGNSARKEVSGIMHELGLDRKNNVEIGVTLARPNVPMTREAEAAHKRANAEFAAAQAAIRSKQRKADSGVN